MQIWFLYKITCLKNNKIYIGQAQDVSKRWSDHKRAVETNKPVQPIHYAMVKHGLENFVFEIIASCKSLDDANITETELVKQYDSFISNGRGYNATLGGMNAPKSDEWKSHMSIIMSPKLAEYKATETVEQKLSRYEKISSSLKGRPRVPGSGKKKGHAGEISSRREFSEEQVREIKSSNLSSRQLAKIYGVNRSTISRIINGTNYKIFESI